jgi:5-methyltetrahydropteroyltriglutamate--homocysteine methyltransferase
LIRSHNHSSYPRVGESPLDQQLRTALRAFEQGRRGADEVAAVEDEVSTVVVAEQSRAFIDVVTDGMVRWAGPLSHLAHHLDGLATDGLTRWFDTNFYDRRVVVTGPIARRGPFLVEHYGAREAVAEALARALAEEVRDLAGAGARYFQLDEPLLCRHAEDLDLVRRTASTIFDAAGAGATTIVSTYYGELSALEIEKIPGTHLGLDVVAGPRNLDLLPHLPRGKGVVLGLFDARTPCLEDADEVAERLAPQREALTARDVIVGPNAGLELLPRDVAFDKLLQSRYLVERLSREWTWA